jgi:hypothetical protein
MKPLEYSPEKQEDDNKLRDEAVENLLNAGTLPSVKDEEWYDMKMDYLSNLIEQLDDFVNDLLLEAKKLRKKKKGGKPDFEQLLKKYNNGNALFIKLLQVVSEEAWEKDELLLELKVRYFYGLLQNRLHWFASHCMTWVGQVSLKKKLRVVYKFVKEEVVLRNWDTTVTTDFVVNNPPPRLPIDNGGGDNVEDTAGYNERPNRSTPERPQIQNT